MKRATKAGFQSFLYERKPKLMDADWCRDALASDARQAAEIRRLRKIERAVGKFLRLSEDWAYHWILEDAALRPARKAGKR